MRNFEKNLLSVQYNLVECIAVTCAWLWNMSLVLQKHSTCWFLYTFSSFLQLLRPIYKQIAENRNAEIFSANTLLVILGTSLLTARVWKLYILVRVFFFFSFCSSDNTLDPSFSFTLLVEQAGLSMALGAFLAGLLLAETEFSLQVESDIAPYRGLLLGLFFMTVGIFFWWHLHNM